MNIIVLFKDLFDLSVVFMQNAFEIWPFADASCSWDFLSGLVQSAGKLPTSTVLAAV